MARVASSEIEQVTRIGKQAIRDSRALAEFGTDPVYGSFVQDLCETLDQVADRCADIAAKATDHGVG